MNGSQDKHLSMVAGEALIKNRRVKVSNSTLVYSDAEDSIGVVTANVASGDMGCVKLWNDSGTFCITSAGTISAGSAVYPAADGKITGTAAGEKIGTVNEAATADDDVEVLAATPSSLLAVQTLIADADALTSATLTDNSGGVDPEDDTIAAVTNVDTLTIAGLSETPDNTPVDIAATAGSCAGEASPSATQVDTAIATAVASIVTATNKNFKEVCDQIVTQEAANTAILAAITQLAVEHNALRVDVNSIRTQQALIIDALQANGMVATA